MRKFVRGWPKLSFLVAVCLPKKIYIFNKIEDILHGAKLFLSNS